MPDKTDSQKFREQALAALEELRGFKTEALAILQELRAAVVKAKDAVPDDED